MKNKSTNQKKTTKEVVNQFNNNEYIKPDDQLELDVQELDEIYGNIFHIREPIKAHSRVIYDHKQRVFINTKNSKNTKYVAANFKSTLLYRGSAEAEIQLSNELCKQYESAGLDDKVSTVESEEQEEEEDINNLNDTNAVEENVVEENVDEEVVDEELGDGEEVTENEEEINEMEEHTSGSDILKNSSTLHKEPLAVTKKKSDTSLLSLPIRRLCVFKKLPNKFNYIKRYTQTNKCIPRDQDTNTQTTITLGLNGNVSPAELFDLYNEDYEKQQKEKEKEKKAKMKLVPKNETIKHHHGVQSREQIVMNTVRMFDKILSLNESDAIAQDFRYYDDPSDQFRSKGEGTIMLMWTMVYEKAKHLFVTDISWSPDYFDMFAVTLGIPQGHLPFNETPDLGFVCLWSLKNTSYPEYVTQTHSGALCLSFNTAHTDVLAVGLRDGSVAVYDLKSPIAKPYYMSTSVDTKHMACVRQVIWCADLASGEMNFFSVSEDGMVCQWVLSTNELIKFVKMSLIIDTPKTELGGIEQAYYARGTTITFNPQDSNIYFVGTIEGYIFKCNMEWTDCMQRFQAHLMPVIRIDFNKYNSNIYLTCSEDYLVKLWEDKYKSPLFTFDLKTALSDVCWSPFSSTTFSVITATDCRIVFYDLDVSTYEAVCDQLIHPPGEYRLTRAALDKRTPLVVIGSSKSMVVTYKLSPNLRITLKSPKKGEQIPSEILELTKLDNVLNQKSSYRSSVLWKNNVFK